MERQNYRTDLTDVQWKLTAPLFPQHQPRRWVVERTFAWVDRCRRLSKDYESDVEPSETIVIVGMSHLMLRRLAPT